MSTPRAVFIAAQTLTFGRFALQLMQGAGLSNAEKLEALQREAVRLQLGSINPYASEETDAYLLIPEAL